MAKGGDSDFDGGGGAGLGGGLFIASAGKVTLSDVNFANDKAVGGNSSVSAYSNQYGGGGGLGGTGGFLGGGGIGIHASGASNIRTFYLSYTPNGTGAAAGTGIVLGAGAGGGQTVGPYQAYLGGANGGGGGQGVGFYSNARFFGLLGYGDPGGGGGIGGGVGTRVGGSGGFGGGGGGGGFDPYVGAGAGGAGGFGGGGGAGGYGATGHGGFGAGDGNSYSGGGGLGGGGAIFVQEGGTLIFAGSGSEQNDSVAGGTVSAPNAHAGSAYGSGIFLQGDETVAFAPDAGHTISITGDIADTTGAHDHSGQIGAGALVLDGQGTLVLSGNNTFTGGITLKSGTLDVASVHGAGSGAITITNGAAARLEINAAGGDLPNAIVIDNFQATGEHYSNGVLTLTDASGAMLSITVTNPGANFEADLNYTIDSVNHSTTITGVATSWIAVNGADWSASPANWGSTIPTAADDATIAPATSTVPYTVSIAHV